MKVSKKHIFIFVQIILLLGLFLFFLDMKNPTGLNVYDLLKSTALLQIVLMVYYLGTWVICTKKIFSLYAIYLVIFYLFSMGQSILFLFNIEQTGMDVYAILNHVSLFKSHIFTIISIGFLHLGALFSLSIKKVDIQKDDISIQYAMRKVGYFLFFISIIPTILDFFELYSRFNYGGYAYAFSSIAGTTSWGKLLSMSAPFFIPSVFMLYLSVESKKKLIFEFILIGISIFYVSIGERTGAISIILAYIWLKYFSYKEIKNKITLKNIVILFGITIIIILIIPVLGNIRNSGQFDFSTLYHVAVENGLKKSAVDTITTLGGSAFPLVHVMEIVPFSKPFSYGQSYFFGLLSIFPNIFGGVHISVKYAGLAQWLMDYLHMSYGPGFSYLAEAYYNFGWYGSMVLTFVGYLFAKVFNLNTLKRMPYLLQLFFTSTFFMQVITSPRRDFLTLVRNGVYYLLVPTILILIVSKWKVGNKNVVERND